MTYPQYRKLTSFKRYYKISDDRNFTEAYQLNGKWVFHQVKAVQYPEILKIQDMLDPEGQYGEMSDEEAQEIFAAM